MNSPKVSVCIPTYNYARFLSETIDSVLKQTFTDYEILIIDDCSHDNTKEVVSDYASRDERIRFKVNPVNIGMVNNWNLCLMEARGEYIKLVFGDDLLSSPNALEKMVSLLDSDPNISLVGSARNLIDTNSRVMRVLAHFKDDVVLPGEEVINRCLSEQKNLVGEPSIVMFRKKDAERGFMPHYKQIVDLEMWFHLLEKGKFAYINEPLCAFRIHPGQQTEKNVKSLPSAEDNFHLYREYMSKPYVNICAFHKRYIQYDNVYRIWKLYTTNNISRELAVREINNRYGYTKFMVYYPFYKTYKPLLKLYRKLRYGDGLYRHRMDKQSMNPPEVKEKAIRGIRTRPNELCFLCGSHGETIYLGLTDRIFNTPGDWNMKRCPSTDCGLIWLDPVPLEEDILMAYQDYYTHCSGRKSKPLSMRKQLSIFWDKCYLSRKYDYGKINFPAWMKFLGFYRALFPLKSAALDFRMMYLQTKPGGRLLEVGCGNGDNLKALQEAGWIVEGVDFDPEAVKTAREKGLRVGQGTLEEQNYSDDYFDAVTMSHLIEHVHNPLNLLNECRRILKSGGRLVIVTPNTASIWHKLFGAAWLHLDPPRHLYLFSSHALSFMVSKAGFQNKKLLTTVREANGVFMASRDIKRSGRHVWGSVQPRPVKKIAKAIAVIEWACLVFFPLVGEEIVLIGEK